MKSIQLRDGDIVLSSSRRIDFVYGRDKLPQDLQLWLLEPVGTGFATQRFGSLLDSMIGSDSPEQQRAQIVAEVQRVLGLYRAWQLERLKQSKQTYGDLRYWAGEEILDVVEEVSADIEGTLVRVQIKIRTLGSTQSTTIPLQLSTSGIQVQAA